MKVVVAFVDQHDWTAASGIGWGADRRLEVKRSALLALDRPCEHGEEDEDDGTQGNHFRHDDDLLL